MTTLDDLLADPPRVHDWGLAAPIFSGLPREAYCRIHDRIDGHSRTLETGTGISTAIFALKKGAHICIAPDSAENERLKAFCSAKGVSLDGVRFILDRSERVLGALDAGPLDLVLIDGSHGFPVAFLDFYYAAPMLKINGTLVIDDIHLWTGRVLAEFLRAEPEWELEAIFDRKTAFFIKKANYDVGKEWVDQPYVVSHSAKNRFARPKRIIGYVLHGKFPLLRKKMREKFRGGQSQGR